MKKVNNEIYALVDEDYLSAFSFNHQNFMKDYYYKFYYKFCQHYHRKPLSYDEFYTNMRRRRIRLYQLCCPYCGTVHVTVADKKLHSTGGYNYCFHCGKGAATDNARKQIYRFIRIYRINRLGLKALKEQQPDTEEWLLAYDCFQMEIIELASIIEALLILYLPSSATRLPTPTLSGLSLATDECGIMILDTSANDKKERKRCQKEKDGRTRKSSS